MAEDQGAVQAEAEDALGWDFDDFAAGEELGQEAPAGACCRAASAEFSSALIGADAALVVDVDVVGQDAIFHACEIDRKKIEGDFRAVHCASTLNIADYDFGGRAPWDRDIPGGIDDVLIDGGREKLTRRSSLRV